MAFEWLDRGVRSLGGEKNLNVAFICNCSAVIVNFKKISAKIEVSLKASIILQNGNFMVSKLVNSYR